MIEKLTRSKKIVEPSVEEKKEEITLSPEDEEKVKEIMEQNSGLISREGAIRTLMHQKNNSN